MRVAVVIGTLSLLAVTLGEPRPLGLMLGGLGACVALVDAVRAVQRLR